MEKGDNSSSSKYNDYIDRMSKNNSSSHVFDEYQVPLPPIDAVFWSSSDNSSNSSNNSNSSSNKIRLLDFHYTLPLVVCADKDNHLILW